MPGTQAPTGVAAVFGAPAAVSCRMDAVLAATRVRVPNERPAIWRPFSLGIRRMAAGPTLRHRVMDARPPNPDRGP